MNLLFILLVIAVVLFVGYPLFETRTKKGIWSRSASNSRARDLEDRKEAIYAAIKDMEFDYQMGKLSDEDFKALRQQYKEEAIGLLKKIDQIQSKKVKAKGVYSKQKQKIKSDSKDVNFCWICGTAITDGDEFCANCGNKLK